MITYGKQDINQTDIDSATGEFSNSESCYINAISIPSFHTMTFNQQDQVFEVLSKIL